MAAPEGEGDIYRCVLMAASVCIATYLSCADWSTQPVHYQVCHGIPPDLSWNLSKKGL
jgi:hypothetical protein